MNLNKYLFITPFLFLSLAGIAQPQQDEYLAPLRKNPVLKEGRPEKPVTFLGKNQLGDTLQLPFFDDFSNSYYWPQDSLWANSAVFVNRDFAIRPPSLGVATFDGLDEFGNAYEGINAALFGPSDSLISQPVDLSALTVADEVWLSFFYQAQGRSPEALEERDSLVLQFKNSFGAWVNVWSTEGIALDEFKPAILRVENPMYFHSGFQFRWINYSRYIGNLKLWHVDYVYLNRGRSQADTLFEDQALTSGTPSVFTDYTHLPWPQLRENIGKYLRGTFQIPVRNLSSSAETFSVELEVLAQDGTPVGYEKLQGQSLPALVESNYLLNPSTFLINNSNDSNAITVKTRIGDILGGNDIRQNDSLVEQIELANYYAYDDGTAETGYGIRNGAGYVALGFEVEKPDTLRAVSFYFTQAEARVPSGFTLCVWEAIDTGRANVSGENHLRYKQTVGIPVYTDSINGFQTIILDSALFINGTFYVGWQQTSSFMLNVGFDRNYERSGSIAINPRLFYNVRTRWQRSNVPGTVMIRPHLGKKIEPPLSVRPTAEKQEWRVYPNPSTAGIFTLDADWIGSGTPYEVYDLQGKILRSGVLDNNLLNLSELNKGLYQLRIQDANHQFYFKNIIIQ